MNSQDNKNVVPRPPIVAILGHIDHGKSSLLDYVRKTKVTEKEHGGITQHIKAYEAEVVVSGQQKKITFLDTPGHEAFCGVRERGSNIADIAILIISAEDGVKPQTTESIKCIKESGIPFLVAINKIDKQGANADKVKQELAEREVLVEGWGGNVPLALISAKTGEGVEDLLETLILQAEVEGISGNPDMPAEGFVLESEKDPKKGTAASLIIKNGTLRKGMFVVAGESLAPVRSIENYKGEQIKIASLSEPVIIFGWDSIPPAGSQFLAFASKSEAEAARKPASKTKNLETSYLGPVNENQKVIPLIIKADTVGSIEAIKHELEKFSTEKVLLKLISAEVGDLSLNDIKLVLAAPTSVVLCFNTKIDPTAKSLALRNEIAIQSFNVIYDLLDWMKEKVSQETPLEQVLEIAGAAKVLKTFNRDKNRQVVGCRVEEGAIKQNDTVKIHRRESEIGEAKIKEIQSQKIKVSEAAAGAECGVLIDSKIEIAPGDKIISYRLVTK